MKIRGLIFFIITLLFISERCEAAVYVSPHMSFYNVEIDKTIGMGESYIEPLNVSKLGVTLNVDVNVRGIFTDIIPLICDEANVHRFRQNQPYSCKGNVKRSGQFSFSEGTYSNTPHYLVLFNPLDILKPLNTKNVYARVQVKYVLPVEERKVMESAFNDFYQGILGLFEIKEFNIKFVPCNERNAYSDNLDGDITICSEILGEASVKKSAGIFGGVLFHELGHTMLNLWNLPSWDNEKTVDEFSVVMLLISNRGKTDTAKEYIEFFNSSLHHSLNQAAYVAKFGGNHPLDRQRIDAIQAILDDPLPVIKRWNNVLYPHMRKEMLQEIVAGEFDIYGRDAELAQKILEQKVRLLPAAF